ncbi:Trp family transcriptional regulator [Geothrix mesophila]|uniref:Trp family transcriptional regulator n=1 Tax=Geothrix mesophila TaxID=2922723 RepID=UPI001FADBD9D|nr:Trp family transcriptional regulator [Geothrix sp. SG198]
MHRNSLDRLPELASLFDEARDPRLVEQFLREILTPSEIHGISSRWELVKRLDEGESQRAIAAELGLSLCKITRGSRELKKPGSALRTMLDRHRRQG